MKKFFTLLTMLLLCSIGAWAQEAPYAGTWYIQHMGTGQFVKASARSTQWSSELHLDVLGDKFTFEEAEGAYIIKAEGRSNSIGCNASGAMFKDQTGDNYTINEVNGGLTLTHSSKSITVKDLNNKKNILFYNEEEPSVFRLVSEEDYANLPVKNVNDFVQGQIYTIASGGSRGSFVYVNNPTHQGLSSTVQQSIDVDFKDPNQQFLFVKNPNDEKYYFYSVGAHAFINVTGKNENNNRAIASSKPVNKTLEILKSTYSGKATNPAVLSIDGHQLGISSAFTPSVITHYNDLTDEGNALRISPVPGVTVDVTDILEIFNSTTSVTYVITNAFGEKVNYVVEGVEKGKLAPAPSIDFYEFDQFEGNAFVSEGNTTFQCVGTWNLPFAENKYYTMKAENSKNFVADGANAFCNNTVDAAEGNDLWQFEHVANTLNLFKVKNAKHGYATVASAANQTVVTFGNTATEWASGTGESSYFCITENGTGFNLQHPGDADANAGNHVYSKFGIWNNASSSSNNGSRLFVTEINAQGEIDAAKAIVNHFALIAGENAKATATTALNDLTEDVVEVHNAIPTILNTYYGAANGKKFTFESRMYSTNRYLKAADTAAELATCPTNEKTAKNVFEFQHVSGNTFKVKSPYFNTFLNRYSTSASGSTYELVVFGENYVALQFAGESNAIHHQESGYKPVSWGTDTEPSKWYIAPVTDEEWALLNDFADYELLQRRINTAKSYIAERIGSGLNQYTWIVAGQNKNSEWSSTLDGYQAIVDAESASKAVVNTAISEVEGMVAALVINQPKAGSFIRVRSVKAGMGYVNAEASTVHTDALKVGAKGTSSIYYYDGTHLLAYCNGQYLVKNNDGSGFLALGAVGTDGCTIAFEKTSAKLGAYAVKYAGNRYLYSADNASNTDAGSSAANDGYTFWLEEVTELPVTIASNGLATFYAPVDMLVPDGTTAYAASLDDEETTITYSAFADNIIPAGHGALLKGTNGTINLVPTTGATEKESALVGHEYTVACSQTETECTEGSVIYTLQSSGNFMYYTGTKLTGFKAHYELKEDHRDSSGNSPLRVVFVDDFTTGIEAVESNSSNEIFDLQGRRVNNAQKGLYIVNGRKVIR